MKELRFLCIYYQSLLYVCHIIKHRIGPIMMPSTSSSSSSSSSEWSALGHILHCKRRNQGCSSAKGRSSTANSGAKVAVLPSDRSSTANLGTKVAVLLGINRCGSFTLLSAPHSLFRFWRGLKRFEKIPGALSWRWREWIWLTRPSGLYRNSPQGLNISSIRFFDQIRDPEALNIFPFK